MLRALRDLGSGSLLPMALLLALGACGGGDDAPAAGGGSSGGTDSGDGGAGGGGTGGGGSSGGGGTGGPGTALGGDWAPGVPGVVPEDGGDDDDGQGAGPGNGEPLDGDWAADAPGEHPGEDLDDDPDPPDPATGLGDAGQPGLPFLSDLELLDAGPQELRVRFTTSTTATPRLRWSVVETLEGAALVDGPPGTQHDLLVTGLGEGVLHHLEVSAWNSAGIGTLPPATWRPAADGRIVEGELRPWHPVALRFAGPTASEVDAAPNPFLDRRLWVEFTAPDGSQRRVEGYFDGDGAGGGTGDRWTVRAHFDAPGVHTYTVGFREGPGVATTLDPGAGTAGALHGRTGLLTIAPRSLDAPGFLAKGRLEYVGAHYLRFTEGEWFLKGGTDSPENLLGYAGIDATWDEPGGVDTTGLIAGLHRYQPHVADFGAAGLGDASSPLFQSSTTGVDSRGLVGALDYLASRGVNSAYFLPMNLGGDGRDTWPFVGPADDPYERTHYDLSKLAQWRLVFEHAQRRGILLHFVLGETEYPNEHWLDDGLLGPERKVFYRELAARYGDLLAVKWNLGEECNHPVPRLREFADWLLAVDAYDHPIAFHTHPLNGPGNYPPYAEAVGDPRFSMTSIQGSTQSSGQMVERWRAESAAAGHPWVLDFDEQTTGLTDQNTTQMRREHLWDVYLSGGQLEWYFGYHALPLGGDLRAEDFRTREEMWDHMRHARVFMESLPFWAMEPMDAAVTDERPGYGGAEAFGLQGEVYAVYLPISDLPPTLDLSAETGTWRVRWYNPRTGIWHLGDVVSGGGPASLGLPPGGIDQDWALTVRPL